MTKFDHENNLPKIFRDNELSILPITRGGYVIGNFKNYHNIEQDKENLEKNYFSFPQHIKSIDFNNITSEAYAIQCAYLSGIIKDFIDEPDNEIFQTVSGRMGTGNFNFSIEQKTGYTRDLCIDKVQIEIDAGYETQDSLILIEAKNHLSNDFIIRQLYYPYRVFYDKLGKDLNIRPVFMTYSNNIFTLSEYEFKDPLYYNSLHLKKLKQYILAEDAHITLEDLLKIRENISSSEIKDHIPFPQADKFERIINLCEILNNNSMNKEEISQNNDFVQRQSDYYTNAARYLGLIEKEKHVYFLSSLGREILNKKYKETQLKFVALILRDPIFRETFELRLNYGGYPPSKAEIRNILKNYLQHEYNDNTLSRRVQTINSWIDWIIQLIIN